MTDKPRNLIFISHANPEDNEIARWLAARLALAGYAVWLDLKNLRGGEYFWETIGAAIRQRACKVLALASRAAQDKRGVLDEWHVAGVVERDQGLSNFVIPLRIDADLPFSHLHVNLLRRNCLDFGTSWVAGLQELLRTLQADSVPTGAPVFADAIGWMSGDLARRTVVNAPSELLLNRLPIVDTPTHVYFSQWLLPDVSVARALSILATPARSHQKGILTFENADVMNAGRASKALTEFSRWTWEDFTDGPRGIERRDARASVVALLRQAWDVNCKEMGLLPVQMSGKKVAWLISQAEAKKVTYRDCSGRLRKKQLVGRSDKNNVFWHYAMSARPAFIGDGYVYELSAHVVFTQDGKTPLVDDKRAHRLRRGFCKMWWNGQWRELFLAYLTEIGLRDGGSVRSFAGGASNLVVGPPTLVTSVVSMTTASEQQSEIEVEEYQPTDVLVGEDDDDDFAVLEGGDDDD